MKATKVAAAAVFLAASVALLSADDVRVAAVLVVVGNLVNLAGEWAARP